MAAWCVWLPLLMAAGCCLGQATASRKKGLGVAWWSYKCGDLDLMKNMAWWYDWQQETKHYITWYHCNEIWSHRYNYVPMVNKITDTFHLENHTHSGFVLGYNEPNHFAQANITGRQAAEHWPLVEQAAGNNQLVSPAAAPCGGNCHGGPMAWFDGFFQHCNGCRVDYIATHIYNCNATMVMEYLQQVYTRYGKKIWLTEFACPHTRTADRQLQFMKDVLPLLEAADYVYRYAWFVHRWTHADGFINPEISLFENNTVTLTPLGDYYRDFGTPQIVG